MTLFAALIVAGAIFWAALQIASEVRTSRAQPLDARALAIMQMFAPGVAACADDPRALLTWQPFAQTARRAFPDEFKLLDSAAASTFPFDRETLSAAHARWTASWLAWEKAHDSEFKLKAAAAADEVERCGTSPLMRARADAIEQEKLETYQRRYEEYIRTAKALQNLIDKVSGAPGQN
ncbi:MAG TPA: hypothetical protein VJP86_01625 [Vicinamibacterales bacterium]|nr:hypothetical protein [Vicinamibacterales bacterium]